MLLWHGEETLALPEGGFLAPTGLLIKQLLPTVPMHSTHRTARPPPPPRQSNCNSCIILKLFWDFIFKLQRPFMLVIFSMFHHWSNFANPIQCQWHGFPGVILQVFNWNFVSEGAWQNHCVWTLTGWLELHWHLEVSGLAGPQPRSHTRSCGPGGLIILFRESFSSLNGHSSPTLMSELTPAKKRLQTFWSLWN